jgi:outer membrane receptor protein involved in Fe transport
MKLYFTLLLSFFTLVGFSQSSLQGVLKNDSLVVDFAYVALFTKKDTSLVKVERTDTTGRFYFQNIQANTYFLKAVYVGLTDLIIDSIVVADNEIKDLGEIRFNSQAVNLDEVTISAQRSIVQIKPDRTIFNVQGTINSTGSNALELLRKAPAVTVDNNDNISVLGRSGVLVYVDGKQLPLAGVDLSNYLKNLPADQIDRFEIITTPGAKYDAEGNAGIIDIRLVKNDKIGANGSLSGTLTQGILTRYNLNASGNYRNKRMNVFGMAGYNVNDNFHDINFQSYQNGLYLDEVNDTRNNRDIISYRLGSDFYLNDKNTIGFLFDGRSVKGETIGYNEISIADAQNLESIDSILIAENSGVNSSQQNTINVNYMFDNAKGRTVNIDLDYGSYDNKRNSYQPNTYYNQDKSTIFSQVINSFTTPTKINIYTGKVDFETDLGKAKFGAGTKLSRVDTKNTFEVYDVINESDILNNTRSNLFNYTENVYAAYLSYARPLGEKFQFVGGLRTELTDAEGDLIAFDSNLEEEPVLLNYINFFPSAGVTYTFKKVHSLNLNYGRRINRPDYNVLNPFRNQLSELSIEKGNPFLKPEIVNNVELGYTLFYMFNFKLGYGRTENKITRLIGPDESKPQAGFISWDNLATQSVWSFNASLPIKITKWWRSYTNAGLSFIDNQADYGNGAVVDVQTFSYMIFQQHTFTLIKGFTGEISGYYSGPGVWGGTFVYDSNWSLNAGLQKTFLEDKLKARLAVNNIFNRIGWQGSSTFNGLVSTGNGMWDSRFVSLSLNYNFGNQNIKSRKRKTGLESESKRVQ